MNQRQLEIFIEEQRQNKEFRDKLADRIRLLNTLKTGYEQLYKAQEEKEKRKPVPIDSVPEPLRNNPYFLLRAGFAGLDSDEQTKKTVIDPKSEASDDPQGDDAFNKTNNKQTEEMLNAQ